MQNKVYSEEEKDFFVKQGIWENNNILFKMIKDDIDHLITQRILNFLEEHPQINALCSKGKNTIAADCKK